MRATASLGPAAIRTCGRVRASPALTSSVRLYYETFKSLRVGFIGPKIETPTGVARFPKEIFRPPRAWVEKQYNVTHWTAMPRGGHFAAMEEPKLFVKDVRTFFADVR